MRDFAMMYDRDLKWLRRAAIAIAFLNVIDSGIDFLRGYWTLGVAALLWCCNIFVWIAIINSSQKTRDESRIVGAAISMEPQ
jgi:hypothetical protein